jgi:hypothetical protein
MGLQVADHDAFQRREWRAQRIGWLHGIARRRGARRLAGSGAVELGGGDERRRAGGGRVPAVRAPGGGRHGHHRTGARGGDWDSVAVELTDDWVRSVDISGITPEPQEQAATAYGLRLTVAAEPGAEVSIQIAFRASQIDKIDAGIRVRGPDRAVRSLRLSLTSPRRRSPTRLGCRTSAACWTSAACVVSPAMPSF